MHYYFIWISFHKEKVAQAELDWTLGMNNETKYLRFDLRGSYCVDKSSMIDIVNLDRGDIINISYMNNTSITFADISYKQGCISLQ